MILYLVLQYAVAKRKSSQIKEKKMTYLVGKSRLNTAYILLLLLRTTSKETSYETFREILKNMEFAIIHFGWISHGSKEQDGLNKNCISLRYIAGEDN